jgi:hypothetical protein
LSDQRSPDPLPLFKFPNFSARGHMNHDCVIVDGRVFHRVSDSGKFYQTFGYTRKISAAGVLPEEYIWETYVRPGSPMSESCKQALVMSYLHRHSNEFRGEYSSSYEKLVGRCLLEKNSTIEVCANCMMNPMGPEPNPTIKFQRRAESLSE